jgi:hypothetical protein
MNSHKLSYSPDIILAAYVITLLMVTADLFLYFRSKKLDTARDTYG